MKQEKKKLIQNFKNKSKFKQKTKHKLKICKKLPEQSDFTIGENYNLNFFKMKDVIFYVFIYFFTNLLIMLV